MEHSISTLTPARVALIPRRQMEELIESRAPIARAFWWAQLVDEDTLRAWIVSMGPTQQPGTRGAPDVRTLRARAQQRIDRRREPQPAADAVVLGDALGLTPVHVNRVLRRLRINGVMELDSGMLVIQEHLQARALRRFRRYLFQRRLLRRTA
jgi:CRP-like cAMP-binding protein